MKMIRYAMALSAVAFILLPTWQASATPLSIRVSGNQLVNGAGQPVQLRGVNRSGTEYACQQGWGFFDGPSDAASIQAMKTWGINAVRVPLNEDCWLGINGINPTYAGKNYQSAIKQYVKLINSQGMYVILDLAQVAPGTAQSDSELPMPDQSHAPKFWSSVAYSFKRSPAVLFDLFNEPYPINNTDTTQAWECWKNGGKSCPGISYKVAGMQELVTKVRAKGASNVIMLGGIGFANILDQWGAYEPTDPDNQLAASFHAYQASECNNETCWNSTLNSINGVPLITGEFGEGDGAAAYTDSYMDWADANGVSYLAWTWDTWETVQSDGSCAPAYNLALIEDYTGTACPGYGAAYEAHLQALAGP